MTEGSPPVSRKRYQIKRSDTTQDRDCSIYVDLVITPAVNIGVRLAAFLYGDGGQEEMQLNTLYQDPEGRYTHIELRTSPKVGRLVHEVWVMLDRLDTYLNELDKTDPNEIQRMRYLYPVDQEARYRYQTAQAKAKARAR